MNLFEYEGKEFLQQHGIPVPKSVLLASVSSTPPQQFPFVLKAQVMTGGRGKAGGVKMCRNESDYLQNAESILRMQINGHPVHGLLAEEVVHAEQELYIAITQQGVKKPTLIFSRRGGMDIESIAEKSPDEVYKVEIDPFTGLKGYQKKYLINIMGVDSAEAVGFLKKLETAFFDGNALLVEINPLGVVDSRLVAMDAKVILDDHAGAISEKREALDAERRKLYGYHPPEQETTTVTYVPLNGEVGLISDGAGTGMLALDMLADMGMPAASFAELGGMTSEEVIYRAMELTLGGSREIKALLIVLIGGFNLMDNMARGIIRYVRDNHVDIPIITRMCGTMEEEGIRLMRVAGLPTFYDLTEAARALRAAVKES